SSNISTQKRSAAASFFQTPSAKRIAMPGKVNPPMANGHQQQQNRMAGKKRAFDDGPGHSSPLTETEGKVGALSISPTATPTAPKRSKTNRSAPLAERMRPLSLDDVFGQD